ncbi:MAG TPA: phosphotransferase [Rhizobiaceae bacterium]|nr:phosphotransferase [Rhizobiaceae bacterium]
MSPVKRITDGAGLGSAHIRMTPQEAAEVARLHYGIEGRLSRFETEKDDTFRLVTDERREAVLKVANPAEAAQEIDLQVKLLEHLAASDIAPPVPRVLPTLQGERNFLYGDRAGQQRHVRLLSFVRGTPLSDTTSSSAEREKVGEALARLRLAMSDFSHEADSHELAWDVKHLLRLEHLLEYVEDRQQHDALRRGLARFETLEPRLKSCRFQVLHNDFSRSNIVVNRESPDFVAGVIDFGDAVRTAIAIDASTALLNQLPSRAREDLFLEGRDILRGYLRHADLLEDELALIPHLVMARVIARALLTIWRARMFPENRTYIMRNTEQGWSQLDWFLSRPIDQISGQFTQRADA